MLSEIKLLLIACKIMYILLKLIDLQSVKAVLEGVSTTLGTMKAGHDQSIKNAQTGLEVVYNWALEFLEDVILVLSSSLNFRLLGVFSMWLPVFSEATNADADRGSGSIIGSSFWFINWKFIQTRYLKPIPINIV